MDNTIDLDQFHFTLISSGTYIDSILPAMSTLPQTEPIIIKQVFG